MTPQPQRIDSTGGDEAAMLLSGCCLAHCLGWPFLIAALPSLVISESGLLHQMLGVISILISLVVLGVAYDKHRNYWVVAVGIAGITLLAVNIALPIECCSVVYECIAGKIPLSEITPANWLTFLIAPFGAALLILAHYKNRQLLSVSGPGSNQ